MTLDCSIIAVYITLIVFVPYGWWLASEQGCVPCAANNYRFIGLWNHNYVLEAFGESILAATALNATVSLLGVVIRRANRRSVIVAGVSIALLIVSAITYVQLID